MEKIQPTGNYGLKTAAAWWSLLESKRCPTQLCTFSLHTLWAGGGGGGSGGISALGRGVLHHPDGAGVPWTTAVATGAGATSPSDQLQQGLPRPWATKQPP